MFFPRDSRFLKVFHDLQIYLFRVLWNWIVPISRQTFIWRYTYYARKFEHYSWSVSLKIIALRQNCACLVPFTRLYKANNKPALSFLCFMERSKKIRGLVDNFQYYLDALEFVLPEMNQKTTASCNGTSSTQNTVWKDHQRTWGWRQRTKLNLLDCNINQQSFRVHDKTNTTYLERHVESRCWITELILVLIFVATSDNWPVFIPHTTSNNCSKALLCKCWVWVSHGQPISGNFTCQYAALTLNYTIQFNDQSSEDS